MRPSSSGSERGPAGAERTSRGAEGDSAGADGDSAGAERASSGPDRAPARPDRASSGQRREAGGLFDGVLAGGGVRVAVGDGAWVRALLDAEAALAVAAGRAGLIAPDDAAAVAAVCGAMRPDAAEISAIGAEAAASGTPVVPLVRRLRAALPRPAGRAVHLGATSQDIVDTATMLVAGRALRVLAGDLAAAADLARALAQTHRQTPVAGRTLLQQAVPTTFGLVCAAWFSGLDRARRRLDEVRESGLAVQLGGAAGTLAGYGEAGPAMLSGYAAELGLAEPALPWHTERTRIADLAGALGGAAGAAAKVARDIVLSAQTEVGELTESGDEGGSSAMAHKHNPIRAIDAVASAAQAPGLVATLFGVMPQEHQRAAGGWYAEWRPLRALFESAGSAAFHLRRSLEVMRVDAGRMRANLGLTHGEPPDQRVVDALIDRALNDRSLNDRSLNDRSLNDRSPTSPAPTSPAPTDPAPTDRAAGTHE